MITRREWYRIGRVAGGKDARMRFLEGARPNRYHPVVEIASFPAEWLWLSPGSQNQLDSLLRDFARFIRIGSINQNFVRGTAQKQHDDSAFTHHIQHREFFSNSNRVGQRQQGTQYRYFGPLDSLRNTRGEDH